MMSRTGQEEVGEQGGGVHVRGESEFSRVHGFWRYIAQFLDGSYFESSLKR
jgi:hypothetical protein